MVDSTGARTFLALLRNLTLAIILYGALFSAIEFLRTGSVDSIAGLRPASFRSRPSTAPSPQSVSAFRPLRGSKGASSREAEIVVGGLATKVWIDPHANSFNRPESLVVPKDDYLGARPHVDTVANLPVLVERCRGSMEGLERMRNVSFCLDFLARGEAEYYSLPPRERRASQQDPQRSEYALPAGHDHGLRSYPSPSSVQAASNASIGTCAGPVIPYHVYWTGPATWRVEAFIKSYLYTQNVPCSRVWLWLDADRRATAVEDMLERDPLFARLLPLVERGDVVVKAWRFPSRIPLPAGVDEELDRLSEAKHAAAASGGSLRNAEGEMIIADGVVEDAEGQRWLTLTEKQMTFLPVAVSDAVRFVVLHLYGGLYLDMDVLLLRDMRPLLLPDPQTGQHSFAERWAAHPLPGDYNTAIMSLTANSSLSSYLVRGGIRMGLNFHPRVIGRMAWKDARNEELLMLESATVDPIWPGYNFDSVGACTVPCFPNYLSAFKGSRHGVPGEWSAYTGPQMPRVDLGDTQATQKQTRHPAEPEQSQAASVRRIRRRRLQDLDDHEEDDDSHGQREVRAGQDVISVQATHEAEEKRLRAAGAVQEYILEQDPYPPTNRTLENFFRGAWTYHIHNKVSLEP